MRVLSGIQPSGKPHIGNYFGMMKPALEMQDEHECYLFIANYHALTSVEDPDGLRQDVLDIALDFLACGLDPEKVALYRQSDLPEVCELTWMLSAVTPFGLLERGTSYKDKVAKGLNHSMGLVTYPVLQTADIIIVQADIVPVGKDQKQHLEFARDITQKFNHRFGEVFKVPEPRIRDTVAVVPGIDGEKMSKSYNNDIPLFGPLKPIRKKMMKIVTDSKELEDVKDPDTCNVFALYKLFSSESEQAELADQYRAGGMGYGHAKQALFEAYEAYFAPMRAKREELEKNLDYVEQVLQQGAAQARELATPSMDAARKAMGLV